MAIDPRVQAAFYAVENNTVNANLTNHLSNTVASVVTLKNLCDAQSIDTSSLANSITALGSINIDTQIDYQQANLQTNMEIYHSYTDMRISVGEIPSYAKTADITQFFGSLLLPKMIKQKADDRVIRMSGTYAEILPSDSRWLEALNAEFQDIDDLVQELSALDEDAARANAMVRMTNFATALEIVSFLDTAVGVNVMDIATTGDVAALVTAQKAANEAVFGFSSATTTIDVPASGDDTPFYEVINDVTP